MTGKPIPRFAGSFGFALDLLPDFGGRAHWAAILLSSRFYGLGPLLAQVPVAPVSSGAHLVDALLADFLAMQEGRFPRLRERTSAFSIGACANDARPFGERQRVHKINRDDEVEAIGSAFGRMASKSCFRSFLAVLISNRLPGIFSITCISFIASRLKSATLSDLVFGHQIGFRHSVEVSLPPAVDRVVGHGDGQIRAATVPEGQLN